MMHLPTASQDSIDAKAAIIDRAEALALFTPTLPGRHADPYNRASQNVNYVPRRAR